MQKMLIVGSSGQAKVIIDIVEQLGQCHIVGLIDSFRQVGETTLGYTILGGEADLPELVSAHGIEGVLIAIGDNFVRSAVATRVAALCPELAFLTAIHPSAMIGSRVTIGPGTVIMAGAVVNPCCVIERCSIINSRASLDHDSVMGEFSSLAPGVTTGGNCSIGAFAAVGIGATLKHGINIGEHVVIGAGATVISSVAPMSVAYGNPARVIRARQQGEKYL